MTETIVAEQIPQSRELNNLVPMLRVGTRLSTLCVAEGGEWFRVTDRFRDAECHRTRSHAERGNESTRVRGTRLLIRYLPRIAHKASKLRKYSVPFAITGEADMASPRSFSASNSNVLPALITLMIPPRAVRYTLPSA